MSASLALLALNPAMADWADNPYDAAIEDPLAPVSLDLSESQPAPDEAADVTAGVQTTRLQSGPIGERFRVEGATLISDSEMARLLSPWTDSTRPLTLEAAQAAVSAINQHYRARGFVTSQAYLPPQEIRGGEVLIRVQEGRIGRMVVSGNRHYRTEHILRQLTPMVSGRFNLKAFQDSLRRSNELNRYGLRASLVPGREPGETDIRLEAKELRPWQITPTYGNPGRPYTGMQFGGVELSHDSLTGYGDRLSTQLALASGTQAVSGSYFMPLNGRGDQLGVVFSRSLVDVNLGLRWQPEILGNARTVGIQWVHPLTSDRSFTADVGLFSRSVETTVDDFRTSLNDLRSVQAGLTFDKGDRLGRTYARMQVSNGTDREGETPDFTKLEGSLVRWVRLPGRHTLLVRGFGQWSRNPLPGVESFQTGGIYSVRGYTQGLLFGDAGYNLTLEDQFPLPGLGRVSPWLDQRLQGAVFFDIGQSLIRKDNPRYFPGINRPQLSMLMGTGVGLRFQLTRFLQGFADVGFGLGDKSALTYPEVNPVARFHFGLRSALVPEQPARRQPAVKRVTSIH